MGRHDLGQRRSVKAAARYPAWKLAVPDARVATKLLSICLGDLDDLIGSRELEAAALRLCRILSSSE